MTEEKNTRRGSIIHYFPIISVMLMWLGACFISSLMVDTPHITHLGFVTLPLLTAAGGAAWKLSKALNSMKKENK